MGGKGGGAKAKPKFKSYAEARKDREKFRKKLVSCPLCTMVSMCIAPTDHAHAHADHRHVDHGHADHLHAQVELIMHRSGDEDEDAEPENCAAPLTCKEKVSVSVSQETLKVSV